jgi:hypothetical protein
MAFIRVKSREDSEGNRSDYAYLVENRWHKQKKQPKQRVRSYLGRVYRYIKKPVDFFDYYKIEDREQYLNQTFKTILKDLLQWELYQHCLKNVDVDLENATLERKGKKAVAAKSCLLGCMRR